MTGQVCLLRSRNGRSNAEMSKSPTRKVRPPSSRLVFGPASESWSRERCGSMIDQFVALCFRKRLVVRLIAIFACVFGLYAWTQLAIDAYPLLSPVSAQVTTQVPGLAAEEIEQQITIPLERALNGTPGLVSMRSISTFALSQINLLFRDGAEDYWERQRVMERIASVSLPAGAVPSLDNVTSPELEIYRYTLQSDTKNLMELSEIQKWVVQPALQQVPDVAGDDNFGGFTRQFRLDL